MKKAFLLAVIALPSSAMMAQSYYTDSDNPDLLHPDVRSLIKTRNEFVLPATVGGYIPLKADLHTHTYFSDGQVSPLGRVREAWMDGLDAIAITDHIEFHPVDKDMIKYLDNTLPDGIKAVDVRKHLDKKPPQDLNYSVRKAQEAAKEYDIIVIPGSEVTREPIPVGHYNALFTTDNNAIHDADPLQSLRNAKAQGALVMHNHPGWRRTTTAHPEFEIKAYGEGLIDGIEVNNGGSFVPGCLDRAREHNLFVTSGTDMHVTSFETYLGRGMRRDMTIILAQDRSLKGLREAFDAKRTIAYGAGGLLAGPEELLRQLFDSSVKVKLIGKDKVQLTNTTSLTFLFHIEGANRQQLPPMSSAILPLGKDGKVTFTVVNMWTGLEAHPSFTISPK